MNEVDDYDKSFIEIDRTLLTALLGAVLSTPQSDAHYNLESFPSFQHVTRADYKALASIIGDKGAKLLRTIPDAVASMTRETAMREASYILSIEAAREDFSALLNFRRNEAFAVIYLNENNRLIDEDPWEGSIDRTILYPREIMRRIIVLDASGILIARNHPSGDTTPSLADIRETVYLENTLMTIEAILLDHLIFGEGEPYSLKENGDI